MKMLKEAREIHLRMHQEMQGYFIVILGTCGVVFNKGIGGFVFYFHILVFQYFIKQEITFKTLNIFYYFFLSFYNFFFKYIIFSHERININLC